MPKKKRQRKSFDRSLKAIILRKVQGKRGGTTPQNFKKWETLVRKVGPACGFRIVLTPGERAGGERRPRKEEPRIHYLRVGNPEL